MSFEPAPPPGPNHEPPTTSNDTNSALRVAWRRLTKPKPDEPRDCLCDLERGIVCLWHGRRR